MFGHYAIPRKRRKLPIIDEMGKLFSKAMHEKDFKYAANVAFYTTLKVNGVEGISKAIEDANSSIRRKSRRKGLT